jgi:hypothetical protein
VLEKFIATFSPPHSLNGWRIATNCGWRDSEKPWHFPLGFALEASSSALKRNQPANRLLGNDFKVLYSMTESLYAGEKGYLVLRGGQLFESCIMF